MRKTDNSPALLARVLAHHRPHYSQDESGKMNPDRQPVCTGCEVFWWPCPTVKLADGTWESVPT